MEMAWEHVRNLIPILEGPVENPQLVAFGALTEGGLLRSALFHMSQV